VRFCSVETIQMEEPAAKQVFWPIFKVLMIGSVQTGKTTLVNKYVNNSCYDFNPPSEDDIRTYVKFTQVDKESPEIKMCYLMI
jgi:GTPase SAR1 family protein